MKVYIDTNILRDCLRRRKLESIRLMEILREKKIACVSSIFTLMELLDIEKDDLFFNNHLKKGEEVSGINRGRDKRDLISEDLKNISKQVENLLQTYSFVELVNIVEDGGWDLTKQVCELANLSAPDSIHLATAILSDCNFLITSDTFLISEGKKLIKFTNTDAEEKNKIKLEIASPEKLIKDILTLPIEFNSYENNK